MARLESAEIVYQQYQKDGDAGHWEVVEAAAANPSLPLATMLSLIP